MDQRVGWILSRRFLYIQEWMPPMADDMLNVQGGLRLMLCHKCPSAAGGAEAAPTCCHHPHGLAFNNAATGSCEEWPLSWKKIITQTTQNEALPSIDSVCTMYCGKIQQGSTQSWMEHGHR